MIKTLFFILYFFIFYFELILFVRTKLSVNIIQFAIHQNLGTLVLPIILSDVTTFGFSSVYFKSFIPHFCPPINLSIHASKCGKRWSQWCSKFSFQVLGFSNIFHFQIQKAKLLISKWIQWLHEEHLIRDVGVKMKNEKMMKNKK